MKGIVIGSRALLRLAGVCVAIVALAALSALAQSVSCSSEGATGQASTEQVCSFHVHADERSVIEQVLKAYGVDPILDSSIGNRQIRFDIEQLSLKEARDLVQLATGTMLVDLDPAQVLVAPDTKENRARYVRQFEKQITIPGLSSEEMTEMQSVAKNVFGMEHGINEDSQGRMVVRAPEAELTALSDAYQDLFAGDSELLVEVQVYEVDQTKGVTAGVTPPSTASVFNVQSEINSILSSNSTLVEEIISSGLASAGDYTAILAALLASGEISGTVFNNPLVLFGGGLTETGLEWNNTTADMLLNTSDVKSLNRMQLRILDQHEATFRSGERYPIESSSYTALGSSSSSSAITVPQVQYQNLGLTLKVAPSIESSELVALNLDLQISSLAGSSINDIPILSNRQYSTGVAVHFGNSTLIASMVSKQDALAISGYAGLGATHREDNNTKVELVVRVTPHLIRFSHPDFASRIWCLPAH
jgi:general secretion pathway protein D